MAKKTKRRCGGVRNLVLLTTAIGSGVPAAHAAVTYSWSSPTGTFSYSDAARWAASGGAGNALNFPGGDAAVLNDIALIAPAVSTTGGYTINFTGMNASTISSLSINMPASSSGSTATMQFNANAGVLSTTGNLGMVASSATAGRIVLSVGGTVNVGGNISASSNTIISVLNGGILNVAGSHVVTGSVVTVNPGGSASFGTLTTLLGGGVTMNGWLTTSVVTATSNANFLINTVGGANLGNVTFTSLLPALNTATPNINLGMHVSNGTVSINDFHVGSAGGAAAEFSGGLTTVTGGNFGVGEANLAPAAIFVDGGRLVGTNAAGLVVGQSGNPNSAGGKGIFQMTSGTTVLEKLTLGGAQASTASATSSTHTNVSTLTLTGGNLYLGSGGIVGTIAAAVPFTSLGSTYTTNVGAVTIGAKASWFSNVFLSLSGNATFKAADEANNPFDITLAGGLTGSGGIIKTGSGKLTLSGSGNNYAGATAVNAGTLVITGTVAGSGITVAPGAALQGNGNIFTNLQVNGTLSPGLSPGTLVAGGMLTFGSGSTLDFDLGPLGTTGPGGDSDLLHFFSPGNNLAGSGLATLALHGTINYAMNYTLFDNVSTPGFSFAGITGYDNAHFSASVALSGGNSYVLSFSAVPEPASLAILGVPAVLLLRRKRAGIQSLPRR